MNLRTKHKNKTPVTFQAPSLAAETQAAQCSFRKERSTALFGCSHSEHATALGQLCAFPCSPGSSAWVLRWDAYSFSASHCAGLTENSHAGLRCVWQGNTEVGDVLQDIKGTQEAQPPVPCP